MVMSVTIYCGWPH